MAEEPFEVEYTDSDDEETLVGVRDQPQDRRADHEASQKRAASAKKRRDTNAAKKKAKDEAKKQHSEKQSRRDHQQYGLKRTFGKKDGDLDDPPQKKVKMPRADDDQHDTSEHEVQVVKGDPDEMLIVGIDLGTTYSGIAWATTGGARDLASVHIVKDWPNSSIPNTFEKTRSVIALKEENPGQRQDEWGYAVRAGRRLLAWFKLLFAADGKPREADDPLLQQAVGKDLMRLPNGMEAIDVIGRLYGCLWKHAMKALAKSGYPEDRIRSIAIKVVLTVPASYGDYKRSLVEEFAKLNGIAPRAWDSIVLVSEPEAAAIYTIMEQLKDPRGFRGFGNGSCSMVVDIGGGTVDIAVVQIAKENPLKLRVVLDPETVICGATSISREFTRWCERSFGEPFKKLDSKLKDAGSSLLAEFETLVKRFTGLEDEDYFALRFPDLGPALRRENTQTEYYDDTNGEIQIPSDAMKSFFDTLISKTTHVVNKVLAFMQQTSLDVENLFLCGGLTSCEYVSLTVQELCTDNDSDIHPRLIKPEYPWAAIAKGAVLHGLLPHTLQDRPSGIHLGSSVTRTFVEGTDSESDAYMCPSRGKRAKGYIKWIVEKGDLLKPSTSKQIEVYLPVRAGKWKVSTRIELYAYDGESPPEAVLRVDDEGVWHYGTIEVEHCLLGSAQRRAVSESNELIIKVHIKLLSDTGRMSVTAKLGSTVIGKTEVDFLPAPYR